MGVCTPINQLILALVLGAAFNDFVEYMSQSDTMTVCDVTNEHKTAYLLLLFLSSADELYSSAVFIHTLR